MECRIRAFCSPTGLRGLNNVRDSVPMGGHIIDLRGWPTPNLRRIGADTNGGGGGLHYGLGTR